MKKFKEFINEKLKISDYRKNLKKCKINKDFDETIKKLFMMYPDHNRNYYRIYIPITVKLNIMDIPPRIMSFFLDKSYKLTPEDYILGVVQDKKYNDRKIKIGKFLIENGREDLLQFFESDPNRSFKDGSKYMVICRHPYDLLGMSTDRSWTSCHDLYDKTYKGIYISQMFDAIRNNCLIAYLIDKDDRNINHPYARIRIHGNHRYDNKNFDYNGPYSLHSNNYKGTQFPIFINNANDWIRDANEKLNNIK
jgi:hypothetical protein